jgi:hypothetical protein
MSLYETLAQVREWLARRRAPAAHSVPPAEEDDELHVIPVVCIEYGGVARFREIRIIPELHLHG